jgi:hypothetical protein
MQSIVWVALALLAMMMIFSWTACVISTLTPSAGTA